MEYSVCVSAVYNGQPLSAAIRKVHKLGYRAFEFWSWWDQDMDAVVQIQLLTGMRSAGFCTRMIPLNVPELRDRYVQGLRESIAVAQRLRSPMLISQIGQLLPDHTRKEQHASIINGLKKCVPILEDTGILLTIEPLNTLVDHKGYYLDRSEEAFEIIREVDSPNVKVLFDVYHQQITEGNPIGNLKANIDKIGHVHIAGVPGRHEPMIDSEVHYPTVLNALKDCGYDGFVGLEYFPTCEPEKGLRSILENMPI